MPHTQLNAIDRFMSHVEMVTESGCWIWIGAMSRYGYGVTFHPKQPGEKYPVRQAAHRKAYELFTGPIPEGLDLDHLCRVRCCVNPLHLEPVTRAENLHRGNLVGQGTLIGSAAGALAWSSRTHCKHGHEYTEQNTRWYRGKRRCRSCHRIAVLHAYHQNKLGTGSGASNC